jgi:hypothetical protein
LGAEQVGAAEIAAAKVGSMARGAVHAKDRLPTRENFRSSQLARLLREVRDSAPCRASPTASAGCRCSRRRSLSRGLRRGRLSGEMNGGAKRENERGAYYGLSNLQDSPPA